MTGSESMESVEGSLVKSGASPVCIVSIVPASEISSMEEECCTDVGIGGDLGFWFSEPPFDRFITELSCNNIEAASAVISSCLVVFVVSAAGFFTSVLVAVVATLPRSPRAIGLFSFESLRSDSPDKLMESLSLVSLASSIVFLAPCSRSFCLKSACAEGAGGGDGGGEGDRLIGGALVAAAAVSAAGRVALYLGIWKPCPGAR